MERRGFFAGLLAAIASVIFPWRKAKTEEPGRVDMPNYPFGFFMDFGRAAAEYIHNGLSGMEILPIGYGSRQDVSPLNDRKISYTAYAIDIPIGSTRTAVDVFSEVQKDIRLMASPIVVDMKATRPDGRIRFLELDGELPQAHEGSACLTRMYFKHRQVSVMLSFSMMNEGPLSMILEAAHSAA